MNNNIKVSIIMPSLNVGKYMGQCLESVTHQTMKEIEIICVDAGSTDGTLQIIEYYATKDNRIKIINSKVKSYGYQMNLGLKASVGEYVGIVETDDYVERDMFEKMYSQAIKNQVDFIKGGYIGFIGEEEKIERIITDKIKSENLNKIIDLNINRELGILSPVHIWSGIYKREFLIKRKISFNETPGASFQDTSFSILVGMLAESCIYIDEVFYHYRMDNANSSVKSASKIMCVIDEYSYLITKLKDMDRYSDEVSEIVERYKLNTYAWNYKRLNAEGRHVFIDAIKEEMREYVNNQLRWKISDTEMQIIKRLTDHALVEMDNEKDFFNNIKVLIEECKVGKRFNIVGAGHLFKKLVNVQRALKIDFIDSVCDNSQSLQNRLVNGYMVKSVEWVINNKCADNWIILSKNHGKEILEQLKKLNVNEDNIKIFNQMIDIDLLKEFCM